MGLQKNNNTMMKKIILYSIFALLASHVYSQKYDFLSLQCGVEYDYYPNIKSSDFYFNYGLSSMIFLNIYKLKIGSGVSYVAQKYSNKYDVTQINSISRKLYDINYLNVPIVIGYTVYARNSNRFDILAGVSFDHIIKFITTTTYEQNDESVSVTENILKSDQPDTKYGISLLFSIYYYKPLLEQLDIFVSPFAEFKVRNEGTDNPHYHWRFPNNGIVLGLKIGLEFDFRKTTKN